MIRLSPGAYLRVLTGRFVVWVTDKIPLSTGLQGSKISRTDFSRNHSRLCSKYTTVMGKNIQDFVFLSYKQVGVFYYLA